MEQKDSKLSCSDFTADRSKRLNAQSGKLMRNILIGTDGKFSKGIPERSDEDVNRTSKITSFRPLHSMNRNVVINRCQSL